MSVLDRRPVLAESRPGNLERDENAFIRKPNVADQYEGLMDGLSPGQRRGLIAQLASDYYDGWRPTRMQLAQYIKNRFGVTARDCPEMVTTAESARGPERLKQRCDQGHR